MKWYEIKAKADVSEVWLYDEIGLWGIGAKEFIVELNAVKSPAIDLHINSPGGNVFDGAAIYNAVKRHPADVTSYIDGLAASMASVIALAGNRVVMAENGLYMIHNPSGGCLGTAEDMRKTADILDKVRDTMLGAYVGKTGQTEDELRALLDAETWMNAEEAKAAGFVDEIGDEIDLAACSRFLPTLSRLGYQHVPKAFAAKREQPGPKEMERALLEVGCSRNQAKAILARGLPGDLRDAGDPAPAPATPGAPRDAGQPRPAKGSVAYLLAQTAAL